MTVAELRELVGQVAAAGLRGGVVMVPRPARSYSRKRVPLGGGVSGKEIGSRGKELFVVVELADLRKVLRQLEATAASPDGQGA
jgi:hypothetical protein